MKDNKIDIMQSKCGEIIAFINRQHDNTTNPDGVQVTYAELIKGIRQLQYDLELLRKCTLDNPDFKWSEVKHDTRSGKGITCFDEDGHEI